ncbi:MAG: glycosyltransferase family 4 protein [Pseudomonadota bacterium]|nr:glycosyltransferase family 4 protein [Pseudomonadota bacterium]
MAHKKLRVALLIDEFFGGAGTQFGGYGMLARNYIAKYIPCDDIKMDVLLGGRGHRFTSRKYHVDNVNLYRLPRKHWASRLFLRRKNYDVYVSIELTDDWVLRHETNKNKKLILWIQDPRPKYEWDEIATMKLMPEPNYYNQRIYDTVHGWYENGRVRFVSQGHFLNQKAVDLYNLDKNVPIQYMPNPIEVDADFDVKNYKKKNMVIFLGRLEDVKRGWLFCETARRMPEYEFWVLGRINTNKAETANFWKQYQDIPNWHFAGHVDGARKTQFLQDAKILMNTSIHEALPVSFLEAMSYGCALVSNRNPDDLTSKFGVWTGDVLGDGFDKIDLYVNAVRELMSNEPKRKKLGLAAREYVQQIHNIPKFINDMRDVIYQETGK